MTNQLLHLDEIAERLRVQESTVRDWAQLGKGPRMFKIGRRWAAYDTDVDRWLAEQYERAGGSHAA